MKSITFEQLKTMLEPMSHTIFNRIRAQDSKIDTVRNDLKTDMSGLNGKIYIGKFHPDVMVNKYKYPAWKDIDETTRLTYDEGLTLLLNGAHLAGWNFDSEGGHELSFVINWINFDIHSYTKTIDVNYNKYTNSGETPVVWTVVLTFEDSITVTD